MPDIKDLIRGEVTLQQVSDGYLWYITESGFPFSVPVEDTKGATFKLRDKGILFMRWIRKALEETAAGKVMRFEPRRTEGKREESSTERLLLEKASKASW